MLPGKRWGWSRQVYVMGTRLDSKRRARKNEDEFLIIITTHDPQNALTDYRRRWGIETLFGALKARGFCLESTHFTDKVRFGHWLCLGHEGGFMATISTTTPAGKLVFGIFASLAEFERDLIREGTIADLAAARARGRKGGRKFEFSKAQVRLAQAAMAQRDTIVAALCQELSIARTTLYRYVSPKSVLRDNGLRVLNS